MHIPWDEAGCLCPVGDFFNYAAPGEETSNSEDQAAGKAFYLQEDSTLKSETQLASAHRLIDAGYEEDVSSYCFYARRNYCKGDQVILKCFLPLHTFYSLFGWHSVNL